MDNRNTLTLSNISPKGMKV